MSWRFLITSLLLVACSERTSQTETSRQNNLVSNAEACRQFTQEGLKLRARTRAGLEAEAGRPLRTSVEVVPNRHVPDAQDSIIRYEYDGMVVQMRKPGPGGEMFEYVDVSKRKWLNFPFFRPGVSAENVIEALGEPQRRSANQLIYECGGAEVENPVVFELKEASVERIVFNYYVD
jgi:hypothetical protein